MVGSMNGEMAIGAGPRELTVGSLLVGRIIQGAGVPGIQMTRLTKPWPVLRQEFFVIGTMRLVAIQAIFANGRVLPEEGPAFFRMAFIALLVHGVRNDHFRRERSMRVVTTRTGHEPFSNRMMGSSLDLGSNIVVAGAASVFHSGGLQERFVRFKRMHRMARYTSQVMLLVHASLPVYLVPTLMAAKTNGGSFLRFQLFGISNEGGIAGFGVSLSWTMAGLASVRGMRSEFLASVYGFIQGVRNVFVAGCAGFAACVATLIWSCPWLCLCLCG